MNRVATRCRDHGRWWWWTAFLLLSCGALALLTMTAPRTADAQGLAVAAPAGPQGKEPVPKAADLRKALTLAREIFEADYAQAKTPAQKSELARKLIDQADKAPGDPAAQFVLLRVARDIAAEAGEAEVACVCIDSTGAKFAIDVATLKIETLVRISQTATSAAQHGALARQCLPLIGQLVDQHRIDEAARLTPPALAAAQKARDGALLRQVREVARTVEAAVAVQAAARDALTVLQQDPEDADAHLVVGKYYCFVRGGWTAGLAHLSRSSDPGLSAVAQAEIAGAQTGAQKTALGDIWWDLAQNSDDADRPLLLARARHWYQLAQPELQGLARVKIEKRLAELAALPAGKPAQIRTWTEPPPPDTGLVR
ncbi:MAG: hypothetical protein HQ581_03955, partial [Planctomycetes bacterium]|nr:hypothetical protein [Planctomycetota bacterium]